MIDWTSLENKGINKKYVVVFFLILRVNDFLNTNWSNDDHWTFQGK